MSLTPSYTYSDSCPTSIERIAYHTLERIPAESVSLKSYLLQEVLHTILLDIELLVLTFCTGILDAVTVSTYKVFCSKQTGNTILIALNVLGASSSRRVEVNVTLSFLLFVSSAVAFGWAGNRVGQKTRLWLLISNLTSIVLISGAATLQELGEARLRLYTAPGVICFLAAAHGGQLQLALGTRMPELNTTMVTGAIANLAKDPKLVSRKNSVRTRRFLYWISILAGAFVGAAVVKFVSPTSGILIAACMKLPIVILFLLH